MQSAFMMYNKYTNNNNNNNNNNYILIVISFTMLYNKLLIYFIIKFKIFIAQIFMHVIHFSLNLLDWRIWNFVLIWWIFIFDIIYLLYLMWREKIQMCDPALPAFDFIALIVCSSTHKHLSTRSDKIFDSGYATF